MSNLASKLELQEPSELPQTLKYPANLKWLYLWSFFLSPLSLAISYGITNFYGAEGGFLFQYDNFLFACLSPLVLFRAHFDVRPCIGSYIEVFNDRLEMTQMGKKIRIPYAEIQKVNFSFFKFVSGGFTLETLQGNYKIYAALERRHRILDSIARYNEKLVPVDKLELHRKSAARLDHESAIDRKILMPNRKSIEKYIATPILSGLALTAVLALKAITVEPLPSLNSILSMVVLLAFFTMIFQFCLALLGSTLTSTFLALRFNVDYKKDPSSFSLSKGFRTADKLDKFSQRLQKGMLVAAMIVFCVYFVFFYQFK
jgi:hypothetical protein